MFLRLILPFSAIVYFFPLLLSWVSFALVPFWLLYVSSLLKLLGLRNNLPLLRLLIPGIHFLSIATFVLLLVLVNVLALVVLFALKRVSLLAGFFLLICLWPLYCCRKDLWTRSSVRAFSSVWFNWMLCICTPLLSVIELFDVVAFVSTSCNCIEILFVLTVASIWPVTSILWLFTSL